MISKEKFVRYINELKRITGIYDTINDAAKELNFFELYNIEYEDIILDILIDVFADDNDWIGYFVYDLEFGEKWKNDSVKDNDKYIALQTPEDLYDLLVGSPRYL